MKWTLAALAVASAVTALSGAHAAAPIYDPVSLNIGLNCKWQARCMAQQRGAMKRAMGFVRKSRPAAWRIHLCNHNAARGRARVDWVGFDNCIRNAALRPPPPPRPITKRRFHIFRR